MATLTYDEALAWMQKNGVYVVKPWHRAAEDYFGVTVGGGTVFGRPSPMTRTGYAREDSEAGRRMALIEAVTSLRAELEART